MCEDQLVRRQPNARFNERVTVLGNVLYFDHRRVDAPYYVDDQGNLFNEHGFEVVSIDNEIVFGGLEWRVGFERDAELFHYVKTGLTIRRAGGHVSGGVGYDSYLYVGGHRCTELGPGFYIHRGRIRDQDGRKVISIEHVGDGECDVEVSSSWFF